MSDWEKRHDIQVLGQMSKRICVADVKSDAGCLRGKYSETDTTCICSDNRPMRFVIYGIQNGKFSMLRCSFSGRIKARRVHVVLTMTWADLDVVSF